MDVYKRHSIDWDIVFLGQAPNYYLKFKGQTDRVGDSCDVCTSAGVTKPSEPQFLGGMAGAFAMLLNPAKLAKINDCVPWKLHYPIDVAFGILAREEQLNVFIYCHGNLVDVDLYLSDTIDVRGKLYIGAQEAAKHKTPEIRL
jgi:hypothetical protein